MKSTSRGSKSPSRRRAVRSEPPTAAADDRDFLGQMLDEAYRLPNWNATHLRGALRRVTPEMAAWRAPHVRRSIADIVVHCAYWKYALRRKLTGEKPGGFPFSGSNWFSTPRTLTPVIWKDYLQLLDQQHERLREAIRATKLSLDFRRPHQDGQWTSVQRTFWLAIHDGYHTGQINLIKAMYRRAHA